MDSSLPGPRALTLAVPALLLAAPCLSACLGPNPRLLAEAGDDAASETGATADAGESGTAGETGTSDGDEAPDPCTNGVQDAGESDVDCGGGCSPCADGSACADANDCASGVCTGAECQAPSCDDAVQNGDEVGPDCGGAGCELCLVSELLVELDDAPSSDAEHPQVALFGDGSFALSYHAAAGARLRWFDPLGQPLGPSVEIAEALVPAARPAPIVAGAAASQTVHALLVGRDVMANVDGVHLLTRSPDALGLERQISPPNNLSEYGELTVDGTIATLTWRVYDDLITRRLDLDDGEWIDINPLAPDDSGLVPQYGPAMARNGAGISVVGWSRCNLDSTDCEVVVRRFETDWIDPAPVVVAELGSPAAGVQVAIADDGRVAAVFTLLDIGQTSPAAWISGPELGPGEPWWLLQTNIPGGTLADVAALREGSFAFAWPDLGQDRVHLQRFVASEQPSLPQAGDEAPWARVSAPESVAIAGVDGRMLVVWSAVSGGVRQIQGQVLGY